MSKTIRTIAVALQKKVIFMARGEKSFVIAGLFLAGLFVAGIIVMVDGSQPRSQSAPSQEEFLETMEAQYPSVFAGIRDKLSEVVEDYGIGGALAISLKAFGAGDISMYECHLLFHTIGHSAEIYYNSDDMKIVQHDSNNCEFGYRHGVEAQIVARNSEHFQEELHRFCDTLIAHTSYPDCYHGAGHGLVKGTLDVQKTLELCDSLQEGRSRSVFSCYTGAFSEVTNIVGGVDSETGYRLTGTSPLTLGGLEVMEYCASFTGEEHQQACAYELNGLTFSLNTTEEHLRNELSRCAQGSYAEDLKEACTYSVSAVFAQHMLPRTQSLSPSHELLETLTPGLREAYIMGSGTEMKQFIISGQNLDWNVFCNFFEEDEHATCVAIFE
ncbi:MAG: hypothetical protein WD850_00710 [Candidatus Spechtbacterales bacterium]